MKALLDNDKVLTLNTVADIAGGRELRDEITVDDGRDLFKFTINKFPSFTQDGRPLGNSQWHLRRDDDDSVLPCRAVGSEFTPVQHRDVYEAFVRDVLPNVPNAKLEEVGTLYGGATGILMVNVGDAFSIKGDKSPQNTRLFIFNPNAHASLLMGTTTVRLWCHNQLNAAIKGARQTGIRIWHTNSAQYNMEFSMKAISHELEAAKQLRAREERLASLNVNSKQLKQAVDLFLPLDGKEKGTKGYTQIENQRNEIFIQFESGQTAQEIEGKTGWTLLNSMTRPIFNPTTLGAKTDMAHITYSNMVGPRSNKVAHAFETVERVLEVA